MTRDEIERKATTHTRACLVDGEDPGCPGCAFTAGLAQGRAEMRERAARECDEERDEAHALAERTDVAATDLICWGDGAERCAERIRALPDTSEESERD